MFGKLKKKCSSVCTCATCQSLSVSSRTDLSNIAGCKVCVNLICDFKQNSFGTWRHANSYTPWSASRCLNSCKERSVNWVNTNKRLWEKVPVLTTLKHRCPYYEVCNVPSELLRLQEWHHSQMTSLRFPTVDFRIDKCSKNWLLEFLGAQKFFAKLETSLSTATAFDLDF